jgi:hypothetical protein
MNPIAIALVLSLKSGLYQCAGNPNICDQEVRVIQASGRISALRVEYVGYCGSMGPYLYPCKGDVCSDGNAEFILSSKNSAYHWKNLGYPYECDFTQSVREMPVRDQGVR